MSNQDESAEKHVHVLDSASYKEENKLGTEEREVVLSPDQPEVPGPFVSQPRTPASSASYPDTTTPSASQPETPCQSDIYPENPGQKTLSRSARTHSTSRKIPADDEAAQPKKKWMRTSKVQQAERAGNLIVQELLAAHEKNKEGEK